MDIIQAIVSGVLLGGLYALIGLGMSLIFGIMKLTNLAHGDLMICGTYICMVLAANFTGNIFLALLITIGVMVLLGFIIQNGLVNRVIDKGSGPSLLVTFGISIIIQNLLLQVFGADAQAVPNTFSSSNVISTQYLTISSIYLLNFIVAVGVIVFLSIIMKKTYFGMAIRASSDDATAAELMGVNTKRMYALTFALAMATAAVAGLLVGMTFVFYPSTGTNYLIIAFGVVVIGGLGSLMGTLVGGIILGLAQLLGGYFFGTGWQLVVAYIVLLVILALRPQGLLSKAVRK
ncbi:branched-chain amino acid ABC transporter permease [Christensenellaceae bacterium OttesenSCG-928-K19]|nr:branched-chain amino acid ABC transporter permease [Christensenellaceae bacterium OttesenSCG-928-K19]